LWRSAGTQDLRFQVAGIANRLGFADGMTLTGMRLTNPTYHFATEFAEVGG
jgi:hypothetical protein